MGKTNIHTYTHIVYAKTQTPLNQPRFPWSSVYLIYHQTWRARAFQLIFCLLFLFLLIFEDLALLPLLLNIFSIINY